MARNRQCGVTNAYSDPGQLGADRWAALIGARHLHAGACLVVNAGTATTIDLLGGDGVFRGGAIVPGAELMKWSLEEKTAGLARAPGRFAAEPRNTADAIETGCTLAQVGAIERMFARLEPGAVCLLSGGAAASLSGRLGVPLRVVENLALEGLARIAAERQ
jgi:type III pantothenate kinase